MPDIVYFDSCIFIELLQKTPGDRFDACEGLWRKATSDKPELVILTSAMTITEVNRLPDSKDLPEDQSRLILRMFENPAIVIRAVDRQIAELAHEYTRTHNLTNIDAIHVATASLRKVKVIYTYDGVRKKRGKLLAHHLKIGNPLLRIEVPPDPHAKTLLDKRHRDS